MAVCFFPRSESSTNHGLELNVEDLKEGGALVHVTPGWQFPAHHRKLISDRNLRVIQFPREDILTRLGAKAIMSNVLLSAYVWAMLGRDVNALSSLVGEKFEKKQALLQLNLRSVHEGYSLMDPENGEVSAPLPSPDPRFAGHLLITGSQAMGFGAIHAGVRLYAGYPMTPSSPLLSFITDVENTTHMVVKHAGRVIPFVAGAKLANTRMPIIAFGGDGATFSEGIGHLVHAVRSNYPITFVLHNNENFALTTAQASALTSQGHAMNSSPNGMPERTLSTMDFVFSLKPTFVARGVSGDIRLMTRILKAAIRHRGFAFVDILQACPTYNHVATHEFLLDRYFDANAQGHDVSNLAEARGIATSVEDRIACGVLYQRADIPDFYARLTPRAGVETTCVEEVRKYDVSQYFGQFL